MSSQSLNLGIVIGASLGSTFGNTLRTVEQRSARIGDSLKRARLGTAISGDVLKYKRRLDQLKKAEQITGVTSDAMKAKIARAQAQFERAARKASKYGIEVGNASRKHREFERAVGRSERALARMEKRQRNKSIRGEMKGQALGMVGAAYGISRLFSGSLEKEEATVRLRTVINSDNVERDLMLARKHATAFMRKGLTNDTDMLGIQYALNSAGFEASAARLGSTVVAKVAKVTAGAPEQVGEVVATIFNNLGGSLEGNMQEKLTRVGELLTKTQFKFQIRDFGQLGESMKYASPILSQYNMDLAQGVTLIGALNSAGLQGSQAGTAFGATMRNMSKASEELGFEMVRNSKGQFDMIGTMESLSDSIGGFENMDQETIDQLQELFGDEGIRGVVLLGKQLQNLRAAQEDVTKSSKGLVDKSYQAFLDSTPGKVKKFWHNTKLLSDTVAESFLPTMNRVLPVMTGYVSTIGQAIAANPELGQTIVTVVGGLVALKGVSMLTRLGLTLLSDGAMILGGGLRFMGGLLKFGGKAFLWLGKGIGKATGMLVRMGVAMLASPITWIVGAVGLLAAGAYLIYKNWEPVSNFFSNMWLKIKGYFAGGVATVLESIQGAVKALPDWALPEGLEADKIGDTIKRYRELADVTGKMKPVDFKLPKVGEVMDDMGMTGAMAKFDAFKKKGMDMLPAMPDMSMPKFPGMSAAALTAAVAATPAAAAQPPMQISVSAPITISGTEVAGMDEDRLGDIIEQRIQSAISKAMREARE